MTILHHQCHLFSYLFATWNPNTIANFEWIKKRWSNLPVLNIFQFISPRVQLVAADLFDTSNLWLTIWKEEKNADRWKKNWQRARRNISATFWIFDLSQSKIDFFFLQIQNFIVKCHFLADCQFFSSTKFQRFPSFSFSSS